MYMLPRGGSGQSKKTRREEWSVESVDRVSPTVPSVGERKLLKFSIHYSPPTTIVGRATITGHLHNFMKSNIARPAVGCVLTWPQ